MSWLAAARPDLVERYEGVYARGAYAAPSERKRIGALVKGYSRSADPRYERSRRRADEAARRERAVEKSLQGSLF